MELCLACWLTLRISRRSAPLRHFMIKLKLSFAFHSLLNRSQLNQVLAKLDINEVARVHITTSNRSFGEDLRPPFCRLEWRAQKERGLYQNDDGISCITLTRIKRSTHRHRDGGCHGLCHWCGGGIFVYWHCGWCVYFPLSGCTRRTQFGDVIVCAPLPSAWAYIDLHKDTFRNSIRAAVVCVYRAATP